MTLNMPDSIYPGDIPAGYGQILVYCDGLYRTEAPVRAAHPQAQLVVLTVTGATLDAGGIDCEPGNPDARAAASWVWRKLAVSPASRPVVYADLATPGYSMTEAVAALVKLGVPRQRVRLLTAHYRGEHICSPSRGCRDADGNLITFTADGTQWTDTFPGAGGAAIDMSLLADDFFGTPAPAQNWTETLVQQLPELRQGAAGTYVRTVQFQLGEHGHPVKVDGSFGPATLAALKAAQAAAGLAQDGVVGPATWPKLLGV